MNYPISACMFIRNNFQGAFCAPETMVQFLHICDEMIILDLGSTDGTIDFLLEVAKANPKIKPVFRDSFPYTDAGVFATLANDLITMCQNDNVIYWQADEFWHEDLLKQLEARLEAGQFDLSFWRIQYANNFQYVKWFPHLIHAVGQKGRFNFVGDGMNTDRVWDAKICSQWGGEMFPQWGDLGQDGIKPYTNEMVTDVSLIGGFRDNIPDRRRLHAPFWHEEPTIPYYDRDDGKQPHMQESAWVEKAMRDEDWTKPESPYNLPKLLKWHVGKVRYELRPEVLEALKNDSTRNLIGL